MYSVVAKKCSNYNIKEIKKIFDDIFQAEDFYQKLKQVNSILLKPNLLGAYSPDKAITTHPVFVSALIEILQDFKIEIFLFDNPGGTTKFKKVISETGMKEIEKKYNINILDPIKVGFSKFGNKPELIISKPFVDKFPIINLAKLKTHTLTLFTGAIKNFYGVVPGLSKANYHKIAPHPTHFAKIVVDIYNLVKKNVIFNFMDGIYGMDGDGPSSGNTKNFGVILGSKNAISLDFCSSRMMGYNPYHIPIITYAAEVAGHQLNRVILKGDFNDSFRLKNTEIKICKRMNLILKGLSAPFKSLIKRFFWTIPDFDADKCNRCKNCIKFCPTSALSMENNAKIPHLDKEKCILCLCCIEICEFNAVSIKKSILGKILLNN